MENVIRQRRVSLSHHGQRNNEASFKDSEYVAAVAAATFAVHSFEEKTSPQPQKKAKSREASMKTRTSQIDKAPSFARPNGNRNLSKHGSGNTKADAWENTELLKIQKRYEKQNLRILQWENGKKTRAKLRVEEKTKELDQRRSTNWQHYQNKLATINHVAGGARTQVENKKKRDETKVKERAKEMRSLGISSPKYCFFC